MIRKSVTAPKMASPAPRTPPAMVEPDSDNNDSTFCCIWNLSFSCPMNELWSCACCSHCGAALTRSWPWVTRAGTAAAMNPAIAATITNSTTITADHRGSRRFTRNDTAGSIPMARNRATPISRKTSDAIQNIHNTSTVTATPAVAARPMKNGERQLNRGPSRPIGASSVLMSAATFSASATVPSARASWGCPMRS